MYDSHILLSIIAITSMILVTVIAAIFSCYSELEEVPSELMRPKAPKSGKIKEGDLLLLPGMGAGFTWGALTFLLSLKL